LIVVDKKKEKIMGFSEINRPSDVHSNHAAPNRIDLLRLIAEGKRPALPEENERPVGENGKPLEKLQLASISTPEHPILPGGMQALRKLLRGDSSRGSDTEKRRLGDYRLRQLLGHGGFGDVYLGEHVDSKRKVAVKLLQHTHLTDQESVRKFREEAGNLLRINHKHIVDVEGFGITKDNVPYLVMEYAPHGTLRDAHPRDTHLPPEKVVEYVNQIADALQYLHDKKN
jgi:serine/threonine protein kinase